MISKHIIGRCGATLLAAALTIGATTAFAAIEDPSKAPAKPAAARPAAPAVASDRTKYCIVGASTGSRIPRKQCYSRSEWIALTGADPATAGK